MGLGVWQLLIILLVVVLLFGAGKLPSVMGDIAKGIKAFKDNMRDDAPEDEPKKVEHTPETVVDAKPDEPKETTHKTS